MLKKNNSRRTKQIHEESGNTRLVPTGVYLCMNLTVNLR